MTGNGTTRWKSEKALQVKREVLTTLEPLEHKPTLKEDVSVMQLSKVRYAYERLDQSR